MAWSLLCDGLKPGPAVGRTKQGVLREGEMGAAVVLQARKVISAVEERLGHIPTEIVGVYTLEL